MKLFPCNFFLFFFSFPINFSISTSPSLLFSIFIDENMEEFENCEWTFPQGATHISFLHVPSRCPFCRPRARSPLSHSMLQLEAQGWALGGQVLWETNEQEALHEAGTFSTAQTNPHQHWQSTLVLAHDPTVLNKAAVLFDTVNFLPQITQL